MHLHFIKLTQSVIHQLEADIESMTDRFVFDYPEEKEILSGLIKQIIHRMAEKKYDYSWGGFLCVDRQTKKLVGTCAYKGPPDDVQSLEISYSTFPMFENQGYATEMVKYLVTKAFSHENITGVTARTLREKNASTHILEKNGFILKGEITDEEDGWVWEWEKKKSSG